MRKRYWLVLFIADMLLASGRLSQANEVREDLRTALAPAANEVPSHMRWEPSWRQPFDCGPISLYLLMRLTAHDVSVNEVINAVSLNGVRGSSLAELSRAAHRLRYLNDVRFVNPKNLRSVPFPFIVHFNGSLETGTGHFFVLCGYSSEKDQYAFINPDQNQFGWIPSATVIGQFSGYVLLPKERANSGMRQVTANALIGVAFAGAFMLFLADRFRSRAS